MYDPSVATISDLSNKISLKNYSLDISGHRYIFYKRDMIIIPRE